MGAAVCGFEVRREQAVARAKASNAGEAGARR